MQVHNVREWIIALQGHPRSSILVKRMFSRHLGTWTRSCTVSEIRRLKCRKSTIFPTPLLFQLKFEVVYAWCWGLQREERLGYSAVNLFSNNSNAWIHSRDGNGSSFVTHDPCDPSHSWPMTHTTHDPEPTAIASFHSMNGTRGVARWYWTTLYSVSRAKNVDWNYASGYDNWSNWVSGHFLNAN